MGCLIRLLRKTCIAIISSIFSFVFSFFLYLWEAFSLLVLVYRHCSVEHPLLAWCPPQLLDYKSHHVAWGCWESQTGRVPNWQSPQHQTSSSFPPCPTPQFSTLHFLLDFWPISPYVPFFPAELEHTVTSEQLSQLQRRWAGRKQKCFKAARTGNHCHTWQRGDICRSKKQEDWEPSLLTHLIDVNSQNLYSFELTHPFQGLEKVLPLF